MSTCSYVTVTRNIPISQITQCYVTPPEGKNVGIYIYIHEFSVLTFSVGLFVFHAQTGHSFRPKKLCKIHVYVVVKKFPDWLDISYFCRSEEIFSNTLGIIDVFANYQSFLQEVFLSSSLVFLNYYISLGLLFYSFVICVVSR